MTKDERTMLLDFYVDAVECGQGLEFFSQLNEREQNVLFDLLWQNAMVLGGEL